MLKRSAVSLVLATIAFAGLSAPALAKTKVPPWRQSPPLNIAHQGGEDEFPSNTMFAFKEALRAGADMLELDIVVTKDNQVIVMHDTTVDSKTNSTGLVSEKTLAEIRKLDGAYWFSKSAPNYDRNKPASAYVYRGIATGQRKPPKGYKAADFRVTTLKEVLKAFPKTPINIEIKGRTKAEATSEYVRNAQVLGKLLRNNKRRDLIVVSFKQEAVVRFHKVAPRIPIAPGSAPLIGYFLENKSLGEGVVAVQVPMTYLFNGARIDVLNPAWVAKTHADGLAWHSWFDGPDVDGPEGWAKLVERCVDGIMTSKPRALEAFLKTNSSPSACKVE